MEREKEEMRSLTKASEIAEGVWVRRFVFNIKTASSHIDLGDTAGKHFGRSALIGAGCLRFVPRCFSLFSREPDLRSI